MKKAISLVAPAALMAALLLGAAAPGVSADTVQIEGEGEGLEPVVNIPYRGGTDMEITEIKGKTYAFAASSSPVEQGGGLHVIDITKPEKAKEVAHLECSLNQGDVQISHDSKTLVVAADAAGTQEACLMVGKLGFMTIDISNPKKPKPIGVAEIPRGSHNVTTHPTKPYVYNSDSDLEQPGEIQIWSIKNPAKPKLVNTVRSLPHSPHDISFNKKGDMAVTAAVSHFDLFDTSDPENPQLVFTGQCPGCTITHDAKFTPDGTHIFIGDEAGGGLPFPCPGGALYAYILQGNIPQLVGLFEPAEIVTAQGGAGACTSHVFDISDDSKHLAIAWYTAGTRYLDISNPHGATLGDNGQGITQLGWFIPAGGNTWSAKLHEGPYIYSNDRNLGFIVYKIGEK